MTPTPMRRHTFPGEDNLTSPSSGGVLSPEYVRRRGRSPTVENVESPMEIEEEEEIVPTRPSPRKTGRKLGAQPQVSVEAVSDEADLLVVEVDSKVVRVMGPEAEISPMTCMPTTMVVPTAPTVLEHRMLSPTNRSTSEM